MSNLRIDEVLSVQEKRIKLNYCNPSFSYFFIPFVVPEGGGGPDPLKNHKNIGFLSNNAPDHL